MILFLLGFIVGKCVDFGSERSRTSRGPVTIADVALRGFMLGRLRAEERKMKKADIE